MKKRTESSTVRPVTEKNAAVLRINSSLLHYTGSLRQHSDSALKFLKIWGCVELNG